MQEDRARRVADALRDRGIDANLLNEGIDIYGVRVVIGGGREAVWGLEGTSSLEAEVLLDGDLVGFIPEIPGSSDFTGAPRRCGFPRPPGRRRHRPGRLRRAGRPRTGRGAAPRQAADARGRPVPP